MNEPYRRPSWDDEVMPKVRELLIVQRQRDYLGEVLSEDAAYLRRHGIKNDSESLRRRFNEAIKRGELRRCHEKDKRQAGSGFGYSTPTEEQRRRQAEEHRRWRIERHREASPPHIAEVREWLDRLATAEARREYLLGLRTRMDEYEGTAEDDDEILTPAYEELIRFVDRSIRETLGKHRSEFPARQAEADAFFMVHDYLISLNGAAPKWNTYREVYAAAIKATRSSDGVATVETYFNRISKAFLNIEKKRYQDYLSGDTKAANLVRWILDVGAQYRGPNQA